MKFLYWFSDLKNFLRHQIFILFFRLVKISSIPNFIPYIIFDLQNFLQRQILSMFFPTPKILSKPKIFSIIFPS